MLPIDTLPVPVAIDVAAAPVVFILVTPKHVVVVTALPMFTVEFPGLCQLAEVPIFTVETPVPEIAPTLIIEPPPNVDLPI